MSAAVSEEEQVGASTTESLQHYQHKRLSLKPEPTYTSGTKKKQNKKKTTFYVHSEIFPPVLAGSFGVFGVGNWICKSLMLLLAATIFLNFFAHSEWKEPHQWLLATVKHDNTLL